MYIPDAYFAQVRDLRKKWHRTLNQNFIILQLHITMYNKIVRTTVNDLPSLCISYP